MRNCKDCLCRSSVFRFLTESELEKISVEKFFVNYKLGEVIFKQGTQATHSISFTKGIAKVYVETRNGETILRLIKPTELISGYGLFFNNLHNYSVSSVTASAACFIDSKLIKEIFDDNMAFRSAFLKLVLQQNLFIEERLVDLLNKKNPGRVASTLYYLFSRFYQSNTFNLDLSREELCSLCAVSTDSFSRILNQFKEGELIKMEGNQVEILNPNMLKRIWENG